MQEGKAVPREWEAIHRNEPLRREITELMLMASDLNIIDWVKPEATRPRALSWDKTKRTTAKHIPIYGKGENRIRGEEKETVKGTVKETARLVET
jgi:hypothetical protein